MTVQLVALGGGPSIALDKPILLFGRDLECDVRFDSRKISRKHCCVAQVGNRLAVRDLGSTNGVRINGVRVVEGFLRAGDELAVGNHRYEVRWDGVGKPAGGPAGRAPAAGPVPEAGLESWDDPVPLADGSVRKAPGDEGHSGRRRLPPALPDAAAPGAYPLPNEPSSRTP